MEQAGLKEILREKEDLGRWSLDCMEQERDKETSMWALTRLCCRQLWESPQPVRSHHHRSRFIDEKTEAQRD